MLTTKKCCLKVYELSDSNELVFYLFVKPIYMARYIYYKICSLTTFKQDKYELNDKLLYSMDNRGGVINEARPLVPS